MRAIKSHLNPALSQFSRIQVDHGWLGTSVLFAVFSPCWGATGRRLAKIESLRTSVGTITVWRSPGSVSQAYPSAADII